MNLLYALVGLLVLARLLELHVSRRNASRLTARGARRVADPTWPGLVALHALFPLALLAEGHLAPWAHPGNPSWSLLVIAALAEALRLWAIRTLGDRWNARLLALPGAPPVRQGPYRWIPHPNYVAVSVQLAALPLAFGLYATAFGATVVNGLLLRARIPVEERGLADAAQSDA